MLISKEDIDEVKARHELSAFITAADVKLKAVGKYQTGLCPFHDDHNASLVVDKKKQVWNCLGACSANGNAGGGKGSSGGDIFAFAMKLWGVDFREAFKRLGGVVRDEIPPPRPRHRLNGADHGGPRPAGVDGAPTSRAPRMELFSRVVEHMTNELAQQRRAQEYFESRGFRTPALWRAFKLGYSSGSVAELAGTEETSEVGRLLKELGILDKDGHERMKGRIVFPLVAFNQLPVGLYGRAIDESLEPHHLFLPGPRRGLFNWNAVRRTKELLVVESVIDALSLIEAGIGGVIPIYGVNGMTGDHKELMKRYAGNVVVALDADETGRKATPQVVAAFQALGVKVRAIEWPGKDPNELLVKHGPAKLREIVESLLAPSRPRDVAPASVAPAAPASDAPAADAGDSATVNGAANPLPLIAVPAPDDRTRSAVREEKQQASDPEPEPPDAPDPAPGAALSPELKDREQHDECRAPTDEGRTLPTLPDGRTGQELADERETHPESAKLRPAAASGASGLSREELVADVLTLTSGHRLWRVVWSETHSASHLRATLRVRLGEGHDAPTFLDALDLVTARAREGFAKKAAALTLFGDPLPVQRWIEADLLRIAGIGEERRRAAETKGAVSISMSDEDRKKALRYLYEPRILDLVAFDLTALGYVGEEPNKKLGYLVSVSRKLDMPLSMVILSPSGAGKSGLADALEALTPEEDFVSLSSITAQALYYMPREALKRKFILIEERAGSIEADYSIRALQSKKKLTRAVPVKDPSTGKIETKIFEILGPAAFLETTTESRINIENATRCFEIHLDESTEQTERIQRAQRLAKTFEGLRAREGRDEIVRLHHNVQRLLRTVSVVIPYADAIEFPTSWLRTRRDNLRFLHLIEVLAFLRQYQRPLVDRKTVKPAGKKLEDLTDDELSRVVVLATLDDYTAAYELSFGLLGDTLSDLKKPEREFVEAMKHFVEQQTGRNEGDDFARREIREWTGLPQHRIRQLFDTLLELEYLEPVRSSRGSGVRYRLSKAAWHSENAIPGLLTPEELRKKLDEERKARKGEASA